MPPASARAGWIFLGLAVAGIGGAVALAARFQLSVPGLLAGLLPGLASLYQSWDSFRTARPEPSLDDVAQVLAGAVRDGWHKELQRRGLNDAPLLPVSWRAAPAPLAEPLDVLRAEARSWPGRPAADPAGWATDPAQLAGEGTALAGVLAHRVPTRRLVVLGARGAGKSTLLIRLLLSLLADRAGPGDPVPVLFTLGTWDPAAQGLNDWLAGRLATDYRGLGNPAPGAREGTRARALLDERRVLPILDGFDELPPSVRPLALRRINQDLPPGQGVVLSSLTGPYRAVTDPPAGLPVHLWGAAGVEVLPLAPATVAAFLRRDAGGAGTASAARWEGVISRLGTGAPVAGALDNPLVLSLARVVYNPRDGERAGALPDPGELLDRRALPTAEAVRTHLYDAFVPAAYRPGPGPRTRERWPGPRAERALSELARHLERNLRGAPDLAWWELRLAVPRRLPRLLAEAACGLVLGLGVLCLVQGLLRSLLAEGGLSAPWATVGVPAFAVANALAGRLDERVARARPGPVARRLWNLRWLLLGAAVWGAGWALLDREHGLLLGLVAGLMTGLTLGEPGNSPAAQIRWAWSWSGVAVGLAGGVSAAIAFGAGVGLPVGVLCGLTFGVTNGWRAGSADVATAVGPAALLAQDRRTFFRLIGVVGAAGAVTGGVLGGLVYRAAEDAAGGMAFAVTVSALAGAGIGAAVGLIPAWEQGAWGAFTVARCHLALRRDLPLRLMGFLADAHEGRGVLRQVGAYYQFRHIALQRRIALGRR
ncbi:NACHT domain-containing protein [Streptomyces sp. DSM 44917]|uniref:NACHT domain-containing protein n=1 Tax=Streptomyces boetiae TaxID=3075541 RepID=A0ABU2LDK1_9ACTN|nr:NACHT domain-containing protein [Streptomyces sp. DSM 44917]MDT0309566.1 NACHT domain-containing protein [Streptomyces sp. DSM 44917]